MRRLLSAPILALALTLTLTQVSPACTFCGGGYAGRQSLRQHMAGSKIVLHGTLENARPDPDGLGGTTDLRVDSTLKTDAKYKVPLVATLPRYVPTVGTGSKEYLAFCDLIDGKLDLVSGVPATAAVTAYLKAAAALDPKNTPAALGFFFRYVDAKDPTVSADAFLEFARATDAEISASARYLDRTKIRAWLADPTTPAERIGVYAMMLGLCGHADDGPFLRTLLTANPLPDRFANGFSGLLAGFTLLNPKAGWAIVEAILTDAKAATDRKFAAVSTVRFFQATRTKDAKSAILAAYKVAIAQGDVADMAVEDLRRWNWWDLSDEVLKCYGKPGHTAPITKRAIVRFALSCPNAAAKAFVMNVRKTDAQLVEEVEEGLKLYAVPGK